MRYLILAALLVLCAIGCAPRQAHVSRGLQTFTPVMTDMEKIDNKDYSELITAVNEQFSPDSREYVDARLYREEAMFMYFQVYSGVSTGCVRVTIDKNRRKILNMQPDCAIEE